MRILAWVAVCLAIAKAQVPSEGNNGPGGKPTPVEASATVRKSLASSRRPKIREALPDPVKYPEFHAKVLEQTRQDFRFQQIAIYPCYHVDLGYAEDFAQPLFDILSAPASLQETTNREHFWPETVISWGKASQVQYAALSIRSREVVFFDGEEQLRYGLAGEAVKGLRDTPAGHRVMRPDPLEAAAPLLEALKKGVPITIHEGIKRFASLGSTEEALKRRGEWLIDLFQFFKTGTVDRDTKALRDLLLKEGALGTWSGGKACGGFHPDFAITWKVAERDVSLMLCFGCHEAMFADEAGNLLYNLPKESYDALKGELEKFKSAPTEVPLQK
jgi:hypothetical protein